MLSIPCTFNKITDYVNKAVDRVFIDNDELITLDPRKESIDKDPRIKAIKDGVQDMYRLNHSELEAVWPTLHDCLLLKRRNAKKKVAKMRQSDIQDNSSNNNLPASQSTSIKISTNEQSKT
ncbi:unnamed protein product [Rotaria socialis]|uniref:Uncharacterized protein n=1 Tax=Rotaria socialis TaxID=392032 RepID=A0A817VYF2_9BILA|nr:unnamed protein product [Rotaria socialis]